MKIPEFSYHGSSREMSREWEVICLKRYVDNIKLIKNKIVKITDEEIVCNCGVNKWHKIIRKTKYRWHAICCECGTKKVIFQKEKQQLFQKKPQ